MWLWRDTEQEGDETMATKLSEDVLRTAADLWEVRKEVNQLNKQAEALRARLIEALEGDDQGVTASGQVAVELQTQTRTGIDSHKLRALYPDVFDDVQKVYDVTLVKLPMGSKARGLILVPDDWPGEEDDQ